MNIQYLINNKGKTTAVMLPIKEWKAIQKQLNNALDEEEYKEPTKEEILENIRQGLKEVQLIEQGKLKSRPAKDFINEL
ncbi:MAG: hypothetical protein IIA88_01030 [Bacteroidetes bacterium]|nr:hypothetical protein [Bacteroidota bacterium]